MKKDTVSNWGGAREGAGRKPRLQYEARELFYAAIDEEWENIAKVVRYYVRKGDKGMVQWLIEQRVGKAPQSVDVSSRNVSVTVAAECTDPNAIDVMAIAAGVEAELKRRKTVIARI